MTATNTPTATPQQADHVLYQHGHAVPICETIDTNF